MPENKNNAKCPFCGAELYVGLAQGTGLCTVCRKQFDNDKAIKLYKSIYEESVKEENKKVASFGEDYLEVERILNRAEYYFERKNFRKAKEELEKGLELTNTDYRLYFGLVRAETSDLSDYKNTTHEAYLNKALSCAEAEEKKVIMRLYKDFYQLSKLSDEDIEQYKREENEAIKKKLEEKFKDLIPLFMKKERTLKTNLVLAPMFLVLCIGLMIWGGLISNTYIMSFGVVFLALSYMFLRDYLSNKKAIKLFNAVLDVYDALNGFELNTATNRATLDQMKILRKAFAQKNNNNQCEDEIMVLCTLLTTKATENSRKFIVAHPVLNKYIGATPEEV